MRPDFVGMALPILGKTNCASSPESGAMKWVKPIRCWFCMSPSMWLLWLVVVVVLVLPSCQVAMSIFSSLWDWDLSSWLPTCSLAETCCFFFSVSCEGDSNRILDKRSARKIGWHFWTLSHTQPRSVFNHLYTGSIYLHFPYIDDWKHAWSSISSTNQY